MDKDTPKLILENTIQTGENQWLTALSGWDLQELWANNVISYNPQIQRGEKIVYTKSGEEKSKPLFSYSNVKKIAQKILEGSYHPDTIVINVMHNGNEKIHYENNTLYIFDGEINILDGQHRLRALDMVRKLVKKNNLPINLTEMLFPVQVCNLDLAEAQEAFYQFSQGMKISPTRAEYFNNKDYENLIVKDLLNKSDLRNKIEIVKNNIGTKERSKVVTFATLVNAIRLAFPNIETKTEANKIADFLCEFFDELIALIPELRDYEARLKVKENSMIAENFSFYGYIALARYLYDKTDWKQQLSNVLKIDYRKDSDLWYGGITKKGSNGYTIVNSNASRTYFMQKFVEEFKKVSQS